MGRSARPAPLALRAMLLLVALLGAALWAAIAQEPTPQPQINPQQQPGTGSNPFQSKKPRRPAPTGGNTAADAAKGPNAPVLPHRVLLLSLDGVGNDEMRQLYEDGTLSEAGFERFFREGEVAEALLPVNPTLTAPNHVSLATGYPPAKTGIVGNRFVPAAASWLAPVSGFDAPIATETLWEAARRQKKKVAVLTWPGADARDERRKGDWGLAYVTAAEQPPQVVSLTRADWKPVDLPGDMPKIASHSPLLVARVELASPAGAQSVDLIAVDRTDDGKVDYDGIVVLPRPRAAGVKPIVPFGAGEWSAASFLRRAERSTGWVKLLAIDPDLAQVRLYFGGAWRTQAYGADFARALAENDLAWPGPPDDLLLRDGGRLPAGTDLDTWSEQLDRFGTFFFNTLRLAAERRDWDLLLGYVPVLDEAGHQLMLVDPRQPGFSPERRDSYAAARKAAWQLVDRELRRLLGGLDLTRTTVVLVSDHGMAPVFTGLDANARLREHGALKVSGGAVDPQATWAWAVGDGGVAHVYLAPASQGSPASPTAPTAPASQVSPASPTAATAPASQVSPASPMSPTSPTSPAASPAGAAPASAAGPADRVADLKELFTSWKVGGEAPLERVLTRQEAAELGLDNPASGDLILFAREGYSFSNASSPAAADSFPARAYGMHGYLATHPDMRAVYMVLGAGVKPGQEGAVQTTDVAARVAGWLGIKKPEVKPPPHR